MGVRSLAEVYEAQAADLETEHWSGPPELVDGVAAAAGTRPGHVVLDVGCGVGGPARRLASAIGCRVVAVDVLEPLVAVAAQRGGDGVRYTAASAGRLPLRDASVDQVWGLGMLAHVPDLAAFFAEARRVLRPGGVVALTEAFTVGTAPPRFASVAPSPWRALREEDVLGALGEAGLVEVRALAWPGGDARPDDPVLDADLRAGRLMPRLVLAERAP